MQPDEAGAEQSFRPGRQAAQLTAPLKGNIFLQQKLPKASPPPKNVTGSRTTSWQQPAVGSTRNLPPLETTAGFEHVKRFKSTLKATPKGHILPDTPSSPQSTLSRIDHKASGVFPALRGSKDAALSASLDVPTDLGSTFDTVASNTSQSKQPWYMQYGDDLACLKLIHTLRDYPNTEDFVYLRRIDRYVWEYNPYALEVVQFHVVNQNDYYTLSVRGMAHYVGGQNTDFTGLDQWERETQLYYRLKALKLFRTFKMWKAFHVWQKAVHSLKINNAKAYLQKNLFLVNEPFQQPLVRFHALCHKLSHMRLHSLHPNMTCTLHEFVEMQAQQRLMASEMLEEFEQHAEVEVMAACRADLDQLEAYLDQFNTKHKEVQSEMRELDAKSATMKSRMEREMDEQQSATDFAYTIAAARRSEQRRLLCFIRMVDCMVTDTLVTVLLESVRVRFSPKRILLQSGKAPQNHLQMHLCSKQIPHYCKFIPTS